MAPDDGPPFPQWHRTGPPPSGRPGKGLAVTALVLGIAACLLFWTVLGGIVLGLAAVVLAVLAVRGVRKGRAEGRTMAITGAALGVLGLVGSGVILALGLAFLGSDTAKTYRECLERADTAAERASCDRRFERDFDQDLR
ncbi:DUF4190 domain-containing protein [Streptomyces sp. NPDC012888]|uniref:DUF4190 domain-containing protein n=1 Tax=Streptomyces sp. NPDC012888 TaxID=3364855 RepID=UPI0036CE0B74